MSLPSMSSWSCPLPLRDYASIVLGHGGGGRLTADLVEHLFVPAFRNPALETLGDATVLPPVAGRLAFSTDAFVVSPLFFPGGSIGSLAVHGTVNDLAMSGAMPLHLSAAFILEEGLPLATLERIVRSMAEAARAADVAIVTGDTMLSRRRVGGSRRRIELRPPGNSIRHRSVSPRRTCMFLTLMATVTTTLSAAVPMPLGSGGTSRLLPISGGLTRSTVASRRPTVSAWQIWMAMACPIW